MLLVPLAPLLTLALASTSSSEGPPPILQPRTYTSPDGHFTVAVDPSRRDGGGSGTYTVKKDGAQVWTAAKPWTLWEGIVTDAGFVAGFAYTEGYRDHQAKGEFHAVILSPKGDVLTDVKTKRTSSRMMHSAPDPIGQCVLHVPGADRVFVGVHVAGDGDMPPLEFWCFQLPDGKELFRKRPKDALEADEHTGMLHVARVVSGTPLILTQWSRLEFGSGKSRYGARYALFDADLAKQWELVRPNDCNSEDDDEQDRFWNFSWKGLLLPEVSEPKRFAIWSPADGERSNFQVSPEPVARQGAPNAKSTWTVTELAPEQYAEPESPAPPNVPSIQLEQRAVVDLESAASGGDSPLGEIVGFAPESPEMQRVVRKGAKAGEFALLHVDLSGKVVSEHAIVLDRVDAELNPQWYPITDHSWIATQSPYGEGAKAVAWSVDDRTGAAKRLDAFDCPSVDDVAGFGDGRFVVLATERAKYTSHEMVIAFDAEGARLWTLEQDYNTKSDSALFSPEAVAITSAGHVWVLDNIKKSLQVFDGGGQFKQLIDLEKAFGQEPNYPSGLEWDTDGGVLLDDFGGKPRLWRLDAGGVVKKKIAPRFADGREIEELPRNARIAPDGRVWSTDSGRLFRLDEKGVVDLEIGAKVSADVLGVPSATAIDVFGRVLIQDEKTGAVHVFDENGKRLFVCKPETGDIGNTSSIASLAALRDGGVIVECDKGGYLTFDARGKRTALLKGLPGDIVVSPASGIAAGTRYGGQLVLMDDALKQTKIVERKSNGHWLGNPVGPAMGPTGSIAVVDGGDPAVIALFKKNGEPDRVVALPRTARGYNLALGRDWAALSSYGADCFLVKLADGEVKRFGLPGAEGEKVSARFGFSADGTELRVLEEKARKLHRFALP